MPSKVKLSEVVDAIDTASEGIEYYLDKRTGEIILITEDDRSAAGDDLFALDDDLLDTDEDDVASIPEWQRESLEKAREIASEPAHFLGLPDQTDIHEYAIMEDFCLSLRNQRTAQEVQRLIKGSGAFRRFKDAIHDLGLQDVWFDFRHKAIEAIAIEWLQNHNIAFTRDNNDDIREIGATM